MALVGMSLVACSKGGGGGTTSEATLAVTTNPANGSTQAAAPGPDFSLTVDITSTMPPGGVTITVTSAVDGSGATAFFSDNVSSSTADNNFTITGTPAQETCIVNITVTSKDKPSNTWSGSYLYSEK